MFQQFLGDKRSMESELNKTKYALYVEEFTLIKEVQHKFSL